MNVTELARILKITPQELRLWLPKYGFDVGQKAIKINKTVAKRVIREWPTIRRKIEIEKENEMEKEKAKQKEIVREKVEVEIPALVTVREFAQIGNLQISEVLQALMKNGIFASLNERIDFDTAWLIGSGLGLDVKKKDDDAQDEVKVENRLKEVLDKENEEDMISRAPVIVVMGHVDHGKTKLLDAIRRADVVAEEAGGITQHIGAYQVEKNKQKITFIDTPGHEAFTAMRSRGAKIADIAILVVAADDGVKPQTVEAYKIIEAAKIPFVVAINKIDKEGADIEKTKQELSTRLKITPEDWGGKTVCAPISALKGEGVSNLLDMVLLVAETELETMKANPEAGAIGSIIESHLDRGAGPVATILIQNGTLKVGDNLMLNGVNIGKVRRLKDYLQKNIDEAGPSTPAQLIGLKVLPQVGDFVEVGVGEKMKARKMRFSQQRTSGASFKKEVEEDENVKKVNLIVKGDVLGSVEAIEESLAKINTKEVRTKIIQKGLGNITEGDVKQAEAAKARIIGFNVKVPPVMQELAREMKVEIKLYSVIYDLINELKEEMKDLVDPKFERVDLGFLEILEVFRTEKKFQIIGGVVRQGKIESNSLIEVHRDKERIGRGKLAQLQSAKQDVKFVEKKDECGLRFEGDIVVEVGDILKFYKNVEVKE